MNFIIMIGLLLREALDRLCVRLNMYFVLSNVNFLRHVGEGVLHIQPEVVNVSPLVSMYRRSNVVGRDLSLVE